MSDDGPGDAGKSAAGQPGPAAADGADDGTTTVNAQVVDAVRMSNDFVLGRGGSTDAMAGGVIAYQQVAHAAALAVQDAVDYQRNALAICTAVQGKAMAMMAETGQVNPWAEMYGLALVGSLAASVSAGMISEQASKMLRDFPRT